VLGQNLAISKLVLLLPQTAHCKFPGHPFVLFVVVIVLFVVVVVVVFWVVGGRGGRVVLFGRSDGHIVICRAIFCAIARILATFLTTFFTIFLTTLQFS
jgi:hypothetical protein